MRIKLIITILLIIFSQLSHAQDYFWSSEYPLNSELIDPTKDCQSNVFFKNIDKLNDEVKKAESLKDPILKGIPSVKFWTLDAMDHFYKGLCLFGSEVKDQSVVLDEFEKSKMYFLDAIGAYTNGIREKEHEIEMRQLEDRQTYATLSTVLKVIGSFGGAKNNSIPVITDQVDSFLREVKNQELARSNKELIETRSRQKININKTIRVPVIPYTGFLKNLVKVNKLNAYCTGSFVGPRLVLTNLHCVEEGMYVSQDNLIASRKFTVKNWWTARGERGTRTAAEKASPQCGAYCIKDDWALIELNESREDSGDYFVIKEKTDPNLNNLMVTGYSGDVSGGNILTSDINCPVLSIGDNISYNCSTFGGSSGSPVLSIYDLRYVVALNNSYFAVNDSANNRGSKGAVRVENFYPTWKKLFDQQGGVMPADDHDSRYYLQSLGDRINNPKKLEKLEAW